MAREVPDEIDTEKKQQTEEPEVCFEFKGVRHFISFTEAIETVSELTSILEAYVKINR